MYHCANYEVGLSADKHFEAFIPTKILSWCEMQFSNSFANI
jgi:hypothetical protein